jgi:hypothetical protein
MSKPGDLREKLARRVSTMPKAWLAALLAAESRI